MTSSAPRDIFLQALNAEAVELAKQALLTIPESPRFTWNFRQRDILNNIIRDGGLDNFLSWPVTHEALYAGVTHKTLEEYRLLPQRLRHMSADFGFPPPTGTTTPEGASGTYTRQMFLAYLFMHHTFSRTWSTVKTAYEVGGGYGAMQVVLRRLGFSGEYTVLDLPALHIVRNWYLANAGIICDYENEVRHSRDVDVLIASHSLCEMPCDLREEILGSVRAKKYIFSITKVFDDVDNSSWFREWAIHCDVDLYMVHENDSQEMFIGVGK